MTGHRKATIGLMEKSEWWWHVLHSFLHNQRVIQLKSYLNLIYALIIGVFVANLVGTTVKGQVIRSLVFRGGSDSRYKDTILIAETYPHHGLQKS